jgi:hypothetical protein
MDSPYNEIAKNFGEENAHLVCTSAKEALDLIRKNIETYNIECEFSDQQGYLFSQDEKQSKELEDIFEVSKKAGCEVAYSDSIPVPFEFNRAVIFKEQAQFHPCKIFVWIGKSIRKFGWHVSSGLQNNRYKRKRGFGNRK